MVAIIQSDTEIKLNKVLMDERICRRELKKALEKLIKCTSVIKELLESAAYWSEYDVPIGIVDRMREAIKE